MLNLDRGSVQQKKGYIAYYIVILQLFNSITSGRLIHLVLVLFFDMQQVLPGNMFSNVKCLDHMLIASQANV